ncbi:MAG TPA: hypothetical protein VGD05_14080 [Pyrinomonadaceae bacterium]|jgi:hypothetical protein
MLKIYERLDDVPEELREHYGKRTDGKYEPQIENINSIGGILNKNTELADEINKVLKPRLREYEGKEVLTAGKIAVDKTEFETIKAEHETYKTLGSLEEIKPKVEGYDELKTETETAKRKELITRGLKAAGITNPDPAFNLRQIDTLNLEPETKDGKEIFYAVREVDGKRTKTLFDGEYLKEADGFKDILPTLTGAGEGFKHFKQSASAGGISKADRIKAEVKEKEAARGNAGKSFVDAFSGTNPG